MNRSSNQPTLRELLRPVREHRLLLIVVVLVAVGASIAYSSSQPVVYDAQASIAYQDQTRDLGLVGLSAAPTQTPDQLAAAATQTIIQPSVAAKVKQALHSSQSIADLAGSVSASVQPNSNLVVIQASAPTAAQAQALANAFATEGAAEANTQLRRLYTDAYTSALKQLRRSRRHLSPAIQALDSENLSRLLLLSTIANAAQVVRPAELPAAPSSPRRTLDAALAAVLGVVLGLLAVYIRDSFDRRLRSVSEIQDQLALPMLGHVRTEALGQSPGANGHGGAAPTDWELFRILRRNLDFLEPGTDIRSVAVTSALPDEGKSTVASFLAFTSAAAGKRTLLIECDLRRPVLAARLGLNPTPGLADYVAGNAEPQDIVQVARFGDPISANGARTNGARANGNGAHGDVDRDQQYTHEVACICAGTQTQHPVEILRSEALATMLREVSQAYELVVIDTPPLLSVVDTLELLPMVDAALICVRVSRTTRQQAGAGRAALKRLPERPTGVVVTGTRPAAEGDYGYYGYYT